ncbi:hypothetical protein [Streptomyces sp. NPDC001507]|uniref:hypothetical protein n=1 Tax=Streptomyces sp. NPDC001507 TaxID=3364579 RepID=UPI00368CDEFD
MPATRRQAAVAVALGVGAVTDVDLGGGDNAHTGTAATDGDGSTPYLAIGGAAALALGSSALFLSVRRRAPRR